MRSLRHLVLALLALAVAVTAPATASARKPETVRAVKGPLKATIGIADQKADFFSDPRFQSLGLRQARRSVAWDALQYDWQIADIDAWMEAARANGVRPLITFARSRIGTRRHLVPTAQQMRAAFAAFRQRYPWVTDFVASNESNHYGEPTGRRPELAAQYYRAMRAACPTCKVAAATLLDYPNLVKWSKAFMKAAKERPKYWALHTYISANRFDARRTREFLRATKGEVWITEVGGAVRRPRGQAKFREGTAHAARVTRFIFAGLARLSPRIKRVYVYHWNSDGPKGSWDSGFFGSDGRPRPAFAVFQQVLREIRSGKTPKPFRVAKPGKGAKKRKA